jgi:outer membrane protein assembly factor BamB
MSLGSGQSAEKRFTSNVVVQSDVIYGMDTDGVVRAVCFRNGQVLWSMPTAPEGQGLQNLGGGVCVAGGVVYATTSFGQVIAFEAKSGKQVWIQNLKNPIRTAPTVSDGKVFVVNVANETHALDAQTGDLRWSHAGLPESTGILGGAVPAIDSGIIVVPYSSGEVYALDLQTGQPKWNEVLTSTVSTDSLSSISHIRARPIIYQEIIYALSHGGRMVALDLRTGERKWQREFAGIRTPALYEDYLYFVSVDGELTCLNRHDGRVIWSVGLRTVDDNKSKISWAGPLVAGGKLLLTGSNGKIAMHSLKDGKCVNSIETGEGFSLSPIVVNGSLITLADSAILTLWK